MWYIWRESATHNFLLKICATPPHSPPLAPAFDPANNSSNQSKTPPKAGPTLFVEMAGIEPACKWVFEKFLQRVVCFKCLNSMSMKQTKSQRIDLLQFRMLTKQKYPESQDITPSSCYETLQDLMSLRLKRKRKQNP